MVIFFLTAVSLLLAAMSRLSALQQEEMSLSFVALRTELMVDSVEQWVLYRLSRGDVKPCSGTVPAEAGFIVTLAPCVMKGNDWHITVRVESAEGAIESPLYVMRRREIQWTPGS